MNFYSVDKVSQWTKFQNLLLLCSRHHLHDHLEITEFNIICTKERFMVKKVNKFCFNLRDWEMQNMGGNSKTQTEHKLLNNIFINLHFICKILFIRFEIQVYSLSSKFILCLAKNFQLMMSCK